MFPGYAASMGQNVLFWTGGYDDLGRNLYVSKMVEFPYHVGYYLAEDGLSYVEPVPTTTTMDILTCGAYSPLPLFTISLQNAEKLSN